MDIKFHEGDFVENNDGRVGYISAICQCDECCKRGFYEPKIEYTDGQAAPGQADHRHRIPGLQPHGPLHNSSSIRTSESWNHLSEYSTY